MELFRFVNNDGGIIEIEAENEHEARIELLGQCRGAVSTEESRMNKQHGYTLFELLVVVVGLASIAGVIALVWAAAHFVLKFW